VSSSSSAGVEEVNPELHAVRLHAALVVFFRSSVGAKLYAGGLGVLSWALGCEPAALPPLSLAWLKLLKTEVSCPPAADTVILAVVRHWS
jgi:hypothetical protein